MPFINLLVFFRNQTFFIKKCISIFVKKCTFFTLSILLIFISIIISSCSDNKNQIYINEFSASNLVTIANPHTQKYDDWIELYNGSNRAIDISGWFLSDNPDAPNKWVFPNSTIIKPRSHILIWADGIDTLLHSNFKLSKAGESISLYTADNTLIDFIEFENQQDDISYGRNTDGGDMWVYYINPTPNASNSTEIATLITKKIADPTFSHEAGFYTKPIVVEIFNNHNTGRIFYTLNGDNPRSNSKEYKEPLQIDSTTILRACIISEDGNSSNIQTKSYFINVDKDLPVISLVSDSINLWDTITGIYYNSLRNKRRIGNFEFFDDRNLVVNQLINMSISGNVARNHGQKAIRIEADSRLGDEYLNYRFFPEKRVYSFKSILLREAGHPDKYQSFIRDGLTQYLSIEDLNLDYVGYRPAILYLNGKYWGIYNIREKVREDYISDNHRIDKTMFDFIQNGWLEIINGDNYDYIKTKNFILNCDKSNPTNYEIVESMIDVDNFINYNILEIYASNIDWPNWNIKFWKDRSEGGRWRWVLVDLDYGMGAGAKAEFDMITYATSPVKTRATNPKAATELFRNLLEFPEFKDEFIQRFASALNVTFSTERVIGQINKFREEKQTEVPFHIDRWKNYTYKSPWGKFRIPVSEKEWIKELNILYHFAEKRPDIIRKNLLNKFDLKGIIDIRFKSNNGGSVFVNHIEIPNNDFTGEYFVNIPIKLAANPKAGYKFKRWIINGKPVVDSVHSLNLNRNSQIEAIFVESPISRLPKTITESTTLTKKSSPYYASYDLVIDSGIILKVEPGVTIYMKEYKSIIVNGGLIMNGTVEDSIVIKPYPEINTGDWGAICVDNSSDGLYMNYVNLLRGSWYDDQHQYKATITSKKSKIEIDHSSIFSAFFPFYSEFSNVDISNSYFESNKTCDFINVKYTDHAIVENCDFLGSDYPDVDAIDFDGVINGNILNNNIVGFNGPNSDAIDIGESSKEVNIVGNKILNISDKGISVGQGSSVIIKQNLIYGCNMGIGIKDSNSYAFVENNLFYRNNNGVLAFEKNYNSGGGASEIDNCIFYDCTEETVMKDEKSHLIVANSFSNTDALNGKNNRFFNDIPYDCLSIDFRDNNFIFSELISSIFIPKSSIDNPKNKKSVIINEINLAPEIDNNGLFWIELYNITDNVSDLSGWTLVNEKNEIITVPRNLILHPKEYLVLTNNIFLFDWNYPNTYNTREIFKGKYIFNKGNLSLYNKNMQLIDYIEYDNDYIIPKNYTKLGIHIDRIDTLVNNDRNIGVSKNHKGTPGRGRKF